MSAFKQLSRAGHFKTDLYDDVMILSVVYAVVVGLLTREVNSNGTTIEQILWCSDRDDRVNWGENILRTYGLVNAVRWSIQYSQRFDAANLPLFLLKPHGREPHDSVIRPPDYLAGAWSSCDVKRGVATIGATKYGQMLRGAIADNPKIALLHLRLGEVIHATRTPISAV